jgi:hypothetical protein
MLTGSTNAAGAQLAASVTWLPPPQVLAGMEMFKGLNSTEREKLIDNLQESIALALALALTLTLTRTCRRAQP